MHIKPTTIGAWLVLFAVSSAAAAQEAAAPQTSTGDTTIAQETTAAEQPAAETSAVPAESPAAATPAPEQEAADAAEPQIVPQTDAKTDGSSPAAAAPMPAQEPQTTSEPASASTPASTPAVQSAAAETASKVPYTEKGADTCLRCHDEDSEFPVLNLFKTRHGSRSDARSPMAGLQCETCHGPGGEHGVRLRRGQERPPIGSFGVNGNQPAEKQNAVCMSCHSGKARVSWNSSAHAGADVACASCHKVHAVHDPAMTADKQADVCSACHARQRADLLKASSHPIKEGEMACSGCHASHGSPTPAMLKGQTLNNTCTQCHAEKRGPFLWEHAPVAEDCSLCHNAHGSNHPSLLTRRAPQLCQQCHAQAGHPSVAYGAGQLPSGTPSAFLLAGACTNCHNQVHGSNHPSGVKLMR